MVTKQAIHALLGSFGIGAADTVLMHTSMRAIGPVEGGCDGVRCTEVITALWQ